MTNQSTQTKKSTIADKIMDDIMVGFYIPGQKLRESQLAERFQSSRAPVREALLELMLMGLVQQIPRQGFHVTKLSKNEIINSYIVGGVLEGYALAQSIHCFFDADFLYLEDLLKKMKKQVDETHRFTDLSDLDSQFHYYLTAKYDNGLLLDFASRASRRIAHYLYFKQWSEIQILDLFYSRHKKIIDVMRTKNQSHIELTLREHYAETGYRLGEYVESQMLKKQKHPPQQQALPMREV